jgi:hypothetical protein
MERLAAKRGMGFLSIKEDFNDGFSHLDPVAVTPDLILGPCAPANAGSRLGGRDDK